jgi:hypothetical protein
VEFASEDKSLAHQNPNDGHYDLSAQLSLKGATADETSQAMGLKNAQCTEA